MWQIKTKNFSSAKQGTHRGKMIGIVNEVKTLLTIRPSKYTLVGLAILGVVLALQLVVGVHAGRLIDASG
ncbi:MAG: hypothetical protein QXK69_04575 [Candidatus Caldarchaeum sp.]